MYFRSAVNQNVELRIINYQFPQLISGIEDLNWLLIHLNVKSDLGNWQTTAPCLLTNEVVDLIKWFNDLSENKKVKWNPMDFMEPNLSFEYFGIIDNLKKIRMTFDLESRPESASDDIDYFVDFYFNNEKLAAISFDLQQELNKFPPR